MILVDAQQAMQRACGAELPVCCLPSSLPQVLEYGEPSDQAVLVYRTTSPQTPGSR